MANQEILVPDMGGADGAEVIEITIAVGDTINEEDTLVVVESDKATVDIPSPFSGKIIEIKINVGDKINEGSLIAIIDSAASAEAESPAQAPQQEAAASEASAPEKSVTEQASAPAQSTSSVIDIIVPDLGGDDEVEVIEVLIANGDSVEIDQGLITLESDKATMDVPALLAGSIVTVHVKVGDKVKEGSVIASIKTGAAPAAAEVPKAETNATPAPSAPATSSAPEATTTVAPKPAPIAMPASPTAGQTKPHASPGVRKFARELGADITKVAGSGSKGRITKEDVQAFIKIQLTQMANQGSTSGGQAMTGMGIEPIPAIDFSQFGTITEMKLSRIKKISGPHLQRAWLNIPHVTHHDEFDITELEDFRKAIKDEAAKENVRITLLAFITQALAKSLKKFPTFNSSLSPDGASLILKDYINIGIAVDTPNGLMVPNIKDCNDKSAYQLANDMMDLSLAARDGKIKPDMLKGGTFSISSLGGIGGTAFTPIVNAPEVAILGITRSQMKPVWNGKEFVPRLMIPLDLSYDHRAIDGAEAARFMSYLGQLLADPKRLLL